MEMPRPSCARPTRYFLCLWHPACPEPVHPRAGRTAVVDFATITYTSSRVNVCATSRIPVLASFPRVVYGKVFAFAARRSLNLALVTAGVPV
jgi:hypothetical protein